MGWAQLSPKLCNGAWNGMDDDALSESRAEQHFPSFHNLFIV